MFTRTPGLRHAVLRWLVGGGDWIVMIALLAGAFYIVRYPPTLLPPASLGSLVGALFGARHCCWGTRSTARTNAFGPSRRIRSAARSL
jgi:hypothetical protein